MRTNIKFSMQKNNNCYYLDNENWKCTKTNGKEMFFNKFLQFIKATLKAIKQRVSSSKKVWCGKIENKTERN